MPGIKVEQNGRTGTVDVYSQLLAEVPGGKLLEFDPNLMQAKIQAPDGKTGTVDVRADLEQQGLKVKGVDGTFNAPETPLNNSPLGFMDRAALGLLSSESTDLERIKQLLDIGDRAQGGQGWDAWATKNEKRALGYLKKNFEDVKIVNDEYVVKKNGAWYKANSPGFDAGDAAELMGQSGLNLMGAMAGASAGASIGAALGPTGAAVGGVAGGILGDNVAEAAEEMLSYGITGGKVDMQEVGNNLAANAMMSFAGEAGAYGAKGLVKGLAAIATKATGESKALLAKVIPSLGGTVSEDVFKYTTASRENLTNVSKKIMIMDRAGKEEANPILSDMVEQTGNFISNAKEKLYEDFGERLNKITPEMAKAGYRLDVGQLEEVVKNAMDIVPEDAGKYSPLMKTINNLKKIANVESAEDGADEYIIEGARAVKATRDLKELANKSLGIQHLKNLKAFEKITSNQAATRSSIVDFLDDKLTAGAQAANVSTEMSLLNQRYGQGLDALKAMEKAVGSGDDKKAEAVARAIAQPGSGSNSLRQAVDNLKLLGITDVDKFRNELISSEAALQFSPLIMNPFQSRPTIGRVAAITALAAPGLAQGGDFGYIQNTVKEHPFLSAVVGTAFLSPRGTFKAIQAGSAVKQAVRVPFDQAKVLARQSVNTARAIGGISRLSEASKTQLLQNANLLSSYMQETTNINNQVPTDAAQMLNEASKVVMPNSSQNGQ